jgi:chromate transport protein ChrA
MHAAAKILIGLILIAIGLGLFVDSISPIVGTSDWFPGDWLTNFLIVLTGFIPPFLILIGLFVVWLEIDEIKAEREIRAEEAKEKREPKKPKKK